MMQQLKWSRYGDKLFLSGELNINNLNNIWNYRYEAIKGISIIDLSKISSVDTAGIALLIHLIATAKKQGTRIKLSAVSKKVITLAQLYNIPDDIFYFNSC